MRSAVPLQLGMQICITVACDELTAVLMAKAMAPACAWLLVDGTALLISRQEIVLCRRPDGLFLDPGGIQPQRSLCNTPQSRTQFIKLALAYRKRTSTRFADSSNRTSLDASRIALGEPFIKDTH